MPVLPELCVRTLHTSCELEGKLPSPQGASGQSSKAPVSQLRPLQVTWEMTGDGEGRAMPGRVATRVRREQPHFSTAEAFHLIAEISEMGVPLLALTGNDPLSRPDVFPVIEFASRHAVRTSLTLRPTLKLEGALMAELKQAGLMRVAFWLQGSTSALDDAYWGVSGAHRRILDVIGACHEAQLAVQVNTTVARRNFQDIDPMFELLTRLDVAVWNVFFLVPTSPEQFGDMLSSDEHEQVFAKLYAASKRVTFQIKTTEGQHYQRFVWQQRSRESRSRRRGSDSLRYAPKGLNDGRASVFINYAGEVYPSRFLPLSGGNVTTQSLSEVYRDSPLLVSLRDGSRLKGKCGRCEMRQVCGGSRPRAYAVTGDLFAEEPCCAYEPSPAGPEC